MAIRESYYLDYTSVLFYQEVEHSAVIINNIHIIRAMRLNLLMAPTTTY